MTEQVPHDAQPQKHEEDALPDQDISMGEDHFSFPLDETDAATSPAENADTVDMSEFEERVEDSELSSALAQIADLEDQLARAHASLYNLDQEYAGYVRRSKESAGQTRENGKADVIEALIPVLDDIHAAREAGDLVEGPFAAIAAKLEETLSARFHVERFGQVGDDFDPLVHEALMAQTNDAVDHPVVAQVLQPGYRHGEKVLRPVKVLVDNPQ
ncbi:nucleotide exchange factor GrpE [Schaalia sp. lx-100]|nr:nucleotide exchange factor GrpE [Schaalia sp. lx-100]